MKGGFPEAGFAQLAALEDRNYWFRARNRLIVWALRRHFPHMRRYLDSFTLADIASMANGNQDWPETE